MKEGEAEGKEWWSIIKMELIILSPIKLSSAQYSLFMKL